MECCACISCSNNLHLKTSWICSLKWPWGSTAPPHRENRPSSGYALASKTELPGLVCMEFRMAEWLCQTWGEVGEGLTFWKKPWGNWWLLLLLSGMGLLRRLWRIQRMYHCVVLKTRVSRWNLQSFGWWVKCSLLREGNFSVLEALAGEVKLFSNNLDILISVFHLKLLGEHYNHCSYYLKASTLYGLAPLYFCNLYHSL